MSTPTGSKAEHPRIIYGPSFDPRQKQPGQEYRDLVNAFTDAQNRYAVDPDWDLTPSEYRRVLDRLDTSGGWVALTIAAALSLLVNAGVFFAIRTADLSIDALLVCMALPAGATLGVLVAAHRGMRIAQRAADHTAEKYDVTTSLPPVPYRHLAATDQDEFDALTNRAHVATPGPERRTALADLYAFARTHAVTPAPTAPAKHRRS